MSHALPSHLKDLARRVAQHEMGHYVVARAMGFRTGDVTIELLGAFDGHRGTAEVTLPIATGSIELVADYLRRRVLVLYAGGVAEALPRYGSPSKKVDIDHALEIIRNPASGAEQDHAKAKELIHVLRNVTRCATSSDVETQAQLDELDRELFGRAVELVELHVDTILGLAGNLSDRVPAPKTLVVMTAVELENLPAVQKIVVLSPGPET